MIPLPVILVEFLIAFGVALLGANTLAYVRLRREGNWPPAAQDGVAAPSRNRILAGMVIGLVVALWGLATWVTNGFNF